MFFVEFITFTINLRNLNYYRFISMRNLNKVIIDDRYLYKPDASIFVEHIDP